MTCTWVRGLPSLHADDAGETGACDEAACAVGDVREGRRAGELVAGRPEWRRAGELIARRPAWRGAGELTSQDGQPGAGPTSASPDGRVRRWVTEHRARPATAARHRQAHCRWGERGTSFRRFRVGRDRSFHLFVRTCSQHAWKSGDGARI